MKKYGDTTLSQVYFTTTSSRSEKIVSGKQRSKIQERLLRQLQLVENLEHTNLQVIIEKNLPKHILIKVHEQRLKDKFWSLKPSVMAQEQRMRMTQCFHCKGSGPQKSALCNRRDTNASRMNKTSKEKVEPMCTTDSMADQRDL
ncbi:hypothetical protein LOAG_13562 [Loa loa]|uniref:Uncharacterized protein n=1 Tax=Loa loa TaxID=7209 RepID=A0A1S0TJT2_LOALO|nr:hypothetical protein LOAG_13562 [Loa loa]EFO14952.1 hypothetical protein LOAG_13562 [Loa loa]